MAVIPDATYNGQLLKPTGANSGTLASVAIMSAPFDVPRRYMHIRPSDKAAALNSQIDRYAQLYAKALGMKFEDFGNPGVISPSPITVVGRIVGETTEKLEERGILLESSRQMGSGCRMPLDLGGLSCSLFPGQIVALDGVNPDGKAFHVTAHRSV